MKKHQRNSSSFRGKILILSIFIFGFVLIILPANSPIQNVKADGVAHLCKFPTGWSIGDGTDVDATNWYAYDGNYTPEIYSTSNTQYGWVGGYFANSANYPFYNLGPPNPMNLPSDETTNIPTADDSKAHILSVDIVVKIKVDSQAFEWAVTGRTFRVDWIIYENAEDYPIVPTTTEWELAENNTIIDGYLASGSSGMMNVNNIPGLTHGGWCDITIASGVAGNFTAHNMLHHQIYVRWLSTDHPTSATYGIYIDYLGIYYSWTHGPAGWVPPAYEGGGTLGNVTFTLVWEIIIFLPAIVINEIMPKVGFVAGILLMLLFLGFTETGFLQVTVIGIVAVAIVLFKGGGDESD